MRRAFTVAAVAAFVLAGCGGGSSGPSNDAKIKQARESETQQSKTSRTLHAKLDSALDLHYYAGVEDSYDLPEGGTCDIDDIYSGDEAQVYKNDSNALVSPDGKTVVEIGFFEGTPTSSCMAAAKDALGW